MGTADTVPKRGFDGGEIGSGEASENGEKMFVDFGWKEKWFPPKKEKESGLVILLKGKTLIKKKDMFVFFSDFWSFFLNSLRLDGGEWVLDQPTEERSVSGWIMGSLHHPNLVVCVGTSLSWGFGGW